jgi:hypothetical protein
VLPPDSYFPTVILESSPRRPKTLRSHKTTAMITTAFKIDLIEPAMGMYELTSQRRTPTTIKTTTTWIKGMIYSFLNVWILKNTPLCRQLPPSMVSSPECHESYL